MVYKSSGTPSGTDLLRSQASRLRPRPRPKTTSNQGLLSQARRSSGTPKPKTASGGFRLPSSSTSINAAAVAGVPMGETGGMTNGAINSVGNQSQNTNRIAQQNAQIANQDRLNQHQANQNALNQASLQNQTAQNQQPLQAQAFRGQVGTHETLTAPGVAESQIAHRNAQQNAAQFNNNSGLLSLGAGRFNTSSANTGLLSQANLAAQNQAAIQNQQNINRIAQQNATDFNQSGLNQTYQTKIAEQNQVADNQMNQFVQHQRIADQQEQLRLAADNLHASNLSSMQAQGATQQQIQAADHQYRMNQMVQSGASQMDINLMNAQQANERAMLAAHQNGATQEQLFNLSQNHELNMLRQQIANGLIPQNQAQAALQNLSAQHASQRQSFFNQGGATNLGSGQVNSGLNAGQGNVALNTANNVNLNNWSNLNQGNIGNGGLSLGTQNNQTNPDHMDAFEQGRYNTGQGAMSDWDFIMDKRPNHMNQDEGYIPRLRPDEQLSGLKGIGDSEVDFQELVNVFNDQRDPDTDKGSYRYRKQMESAKGRLNNRSWSQIMNLNPDLEQRFENYIDQLASAQILGMTYDTGYAQERTDNWKIKNKNGQEVKGLINYFKDKYPDWEARVAQFKDDYLKQFNYNRDNNIRGSHFGRG